MQGVDWKLYKIGKIMYKNQYSDDSQLEIIMEKTLLHRKSLKEKNIPRNKDFCKV